MKRPASRAAVGLVRAVALRIVGFAALWAVLVEGRAGGWLVAGATVTAAVVTSLALLPPGGARLRLGGVLRFVPFFLRQSAVGGFDVARRALHPRLRIRPAYLEYRLTLPPGRARVFFAGVVSLLPGTLSLALRDDVLQVHALDERMPTEATLRALEARIADALGVEGETRAS